MSTNIYSKFLEFVYFRLLIYIYIYIFFLIIFSHFAEGWSRCRLDDNQLRAREGDRFHKAIHEFGYLDPVQGKQESISPDSNFDVQNRENLSRYKVAIVFSSSEAFKVILYKPPL